MKKTSFVILLAVAVLFIITHYAYSEDDSKPKIPVYLSKPLVPTPPDYLAPDDHADENLSAGLCGNQKIEAGEECDDGNLKDGDGCSAVCKTEEKKKEETSVLSRCGDNVLDSGEACDGAAGGCAPGQVCENCACVNRGVAFCGNGTVESGEQCDGDSAPCPRGLICNRNCQCGTSQHNSAECGNGIISLGEECGEAGLPQCPPGLECTACRCTQIGCGYANCPNDSRCRVQYCRDQEGECVIGRPELDGGVVREQYGSGEIDVPECCARIRYDLYVGFNPCTGEVDSSSYRVQISGTSRTSEQHCYCALREPDGTYVDETGQTVDCHDSVDRNRDVQVGADNGSSPRIRISCSNCCGDQITTERTLESASNRPPVDCGLTDCPTI